MAPSSSKRWNRHRTLPLASSATPVLLVVAAMLIASSAAARIVNRLEPTELLRDE